MKKLPLFTGAFPKYCFQLSVDHQLRGENLIVSHYFHEIHSFSYFFTQVKCLGDVSIIYRNFLLQNYLTERIHNADPCISRKIILQLQMHLERTISWIGIKCKRSR